MVVWFVGCCGLLFFFVWCCIDVLSLVGVVVCGLLRSLLLVACFRCSFCCLLPVACLYCCCLSVSGCSLLFVVS